MPRRVKSPLDSFPQAPGPRCAAPSEVVYLSEFDVKPVVASRCPSLRDVAEVTAGLATAGRRARGYRPLLKRVPL